MAAIVTPAERKQAAGHTTGIWSPLTSFAGRASEATELTRLLKNYRLVTVTGPGGVGKTRLATEVARRVQDLFPDGVWFVGLSGVAYAAHVPTEVTTVLGVRQIRGRPPVEALTEALAALFTGRARQADPRFTLSPECAPLVARVVAGWTGCRWRSSWPRRGSRHWAWPGSPWNICFAPLFCCP